MMINDVEDLSIYLLAICMSSLEKKKSIQFLCPCFKSDFGGFSFFAVELYEYFIFLILTPSIYLI